MRFWLNDLGDFVSRHWGDFIGLLLLYTGVGLAILAAYAGVPGEKFAHLGESLVLAAMGVLKLRSNPKQNGNGG